MIEFIDENATIEPVAVEENKQENKNSAKKVSKQPSKKIEQSANKKEVSENKNCIW